MWQFVATFCFLGKLPYAPGTWGSLGALILWMLLPYTFFIHFIVIIALFILGVISSQKISHHLNNHDPSEVVIDEAIGICIALFFLPYNLTIYILAFILFRLFDIFKPSFIYQIQDLPGGWGIMVDDVLAGLFTLALVNGIATIL